MGENTVVLQINSQILSRQAQWYCLITNEQTPLIYIVHMTCHKVLQIDSEARPYNASAHMKPGVSESTISRCSGRAHSWELWRPLYLADLNPTFSFLFFKKGGKEFWPRLAAWPICACLWLHVCLDVSLSLSLPLPVCVPCAICR